VKIHLPALGPDLPIHPRTGLSALGLRRNGAPIWPVRGASPDHDGDDSDADDGDGDQGDGDGDDQDGDNADDLRDAGKKALDTMKGQRNKARADLRPWTALARELGVRSPDEVRNLLKGKAKDGGDAPDPDQIRREARAEVEREVTRERLLDKIEAKARKFADPADAAALLLRESDADDFLDGTRIDGDAIAEALEELLERKPYLAAKAADTELRRPKPDRSQGSRGNAKLSSADRAAKRLERLGIRKPSST
jgi:hypothetical protein